jgi:hypothetical protein
MISTRFRPGDIVACGHDKVRATVLAVGERHTFVRHDDGSEASWPHVHVTYLGHPDPVSLARRSSVWPL